MQGGIEYRKRPEGYTPPDGPIFRHDNFNGDADKANSPWDDGDPRDRLFDAAATEGPWEPSTEEDGGIRFDLPSTRQQGTIYASEPPSGDDESLSYHAYHAYSHSGDKSESRENSDSRSSFDFSTAIGHLNSVTFKG